jgi:UDP-glucuronate 4-epimerase
MSNSARRYLVTGAAGFIGAAVAKRLLTAGEQVVGIDNLNDYYDVNLKLARLDTLKPHDAFTFETLDLADGAALTALFKKHRFTHVINLAAQAGVRYSIENPQTYIQSNIVGFSHLLECCRHFEVEHMVYASSSSVYGDTSELPFATEQRTDTPVSLYAATKKSNEVLAYSYSHLYQLPLTGLRYFTVYGPWGRPDMAPFKFTKAVIEGKPITVYHHGKHRRDFTFVDDIVSGTLLTVEHPPQGDAPHAVYNIGFGQPIALMDFIGYIEQATGREAIKEFVGKQPGDVEATWSDISDLTALTGYQPKTPCKDGIEQFVAWYRDFYSK